MPRKRTTSVAVLAAPMLLLLALPSIAEPPAAAGGARSTAVPSAFGALTGPAGGAPDDLAVGYLRGNPDRFGVKKPDVAELGVLSSYLSEHSGVRHVNVNQRFRDLEVFDGYATVNVAKDGSILHVGASLVPSLREAPGSAAAKASKQPVEPAQAVEAAARGLKLKKTKEVKVVKAKGGPSRETVLSDGGVSDAPIPARLGWQPTANGLRLAWQLVIEDGAEVHLWNATVDAQTGALLDVDDWAVSHSEEDLAHLSRGETAAASTASTAGTATAAASTASAAASTHGPPNRFVDGSAYNVLELPKESPNDGPRTVVTNPADRDASKLGWHDTGLPGGKFTTTRGNNVHAYLDQDANNTPDAQQDVDGGAALRFDFEKDHSEHAQAYRQAATTNLFYANNVIHDVLYGYGFTEAAGNFQANRFGTTLPNGTLMPEGDYVRAEVADGAGSNNANFSTPPSGGTPRMQMYLWPGAQFGLPNSITVGTEVFAAGFARFGPPARNAGLTGRLVVAGGNGCAAADYADAAGAVAITVNVTTPDACTNVARTAAAQAAGAAAVVIAQTTADAAAGTLTGLQTGAPVGIPAVSVTLQTGDALRALAGQTAKVAKAAAHPGVRDGDFDTGVIVHEYGHGVSNRLTGGPGVNCLSGSEQMGEGWSDFLAISMLLDPTKDDPEGRRGMGPYVLFQPDRTGNGIRVTPYSRNMAINPFTYDNIKTGGWRNGATIAQPHGVGWGWASTLWDMTWDLVDRHGFHDNVYDAWNAGGNNRAIQYVMDGMKMQGCAPGFVAGRDGILAASQALGGQDTCLIWSSFARRGLGFSSKQGTTDRNDGTEAFDVPPACKAPGAGFVGPRVQQQAVTRVDAGSTVPLQFNLGGDKTLKVLKPRHSPSSQRIDCETRRPFGTSTAPDERITAPIAGPGNTGLTYNRSQDRYQLNWQTDAAWSGTCRQLILTLADGTQHRADFRFTAPA